MEDKKVEVNVDYVEFFDGGMDIWWYGNIGWGHLVVYTVSGQNENEEVIYKMDTECMGKDFVFDIMNKAKEFIIQKTNNLPNY
jgi:hypothetical protein